jgi:hypothetical protein
MSYLLYPLAFFLVYWKMTLLGCVFERSKETEDKCVFTNSIEIADNGITFPRFRARRCLSSVFCPGLLIAPATTGSDFRHLNRSNVMAGLQALRGNSDIFHLQLDEIYSWLYRCPRMCPETPWVVRGRAKVVH